MLTLTKKNYMQKDKICKDTLKAYPNISKHVLVKKTMQKSQKT